MIKGTDMMPMDPLKLTAEQSLSMVQQAEPTQLLTMTTTQN